MSVMNESLLGLMDTVVQQQQDHLQHHLHHHLHHHHVHHQFPLSNCSHILITIILLVSTFLSIPGNLLVAWVVIKTPTLRAKAVNTLIVNLCFIDLISAAFDAPLSWTIFRNRHAHDPNPKWVCSWQLFCHTMSIAGQILSFVSVGYERYHTVSNPFDKEKVRKITHVFVFCCWIIASGIAGLLIQIAPDTIGYNFCIGNDHFLRTDIPHTHRGVVFVMIPFGITSFALVAFFYTRIIWLVRKHCRNVSTVTRKFPISTVGNAIDISNGSELPSIYGEVCVLDAGNRSIGKRRLEAETAKKSFFVIISFVAFTVPYPLMVSLEKTFDLSSARPQIYELEYAFNALTILSSGLNPLVYGLANRQFRSAFRKLGSHYYRRYHRDDL